MTSYSKSYASRSNARRAAKGDPDWTGEVVQLADDLGFVYVIKADELDAEPVTTLEEVSKQVDEAVAAGADTDPRATKNDKPRQPKPAHVAKSGIEKPVAAVHRIATEMYQANPNVARKDILAVCLKAGIATHTAATQYARWKKTNAV